MRDKLYSLQALRAVAALLVIHLHAVEAAVQCTGGVGSLGRLGIIGRAGVDIFFVISGVIIARTALNHTASDFIRRRFIRIVPVYLIWCIPGLLIAWRNHAIGWRVLLATALWPATDRMTASVLPVAWTLSFEMLFYAAAALVLLNRRLLWALLCLFAAAFLARPLGAIFQYAGNPIILEFLAGAMIAYAPPSSPKVGAAAIATGIAALVAGAILLLPPTGDTISFLEGTQAIARLGVLGIPAALIVYGTLQIQVRKGVLTYLGDASYSLYLTHPLIATLVAAGAVFAPAMRHMPPDLIIIGCMALCVLFGWRCYELFEKPVLTFFRNRARDPALSAT